MELVDLQRESQVDSGASPGSPYQNGGPVSNWKMEPPLLHPLFGTLMTMMIVVLSLSLSL